MTPTFEALNQSVADLASASAVMGGLMKADGSSHLSTEQGADALAPVILAQRRLAENLDLCRAACEADRDLLKNTDNSHVWDEANRIYAGVIVGYKMAQTPPTERWPYCAMMGECQKAQA